MVALVALTLLPLGLQSNSHVHARRVGVAVVDMLAVANRMLLRAVPVSSSPRLAALVVPGIAICYGKQGKKPADVSLPF